MKKSLLAASLVLVTAAACGSSGGGDTASSAPSEASTKDFCAEVTATNADTTGKDLADRLNKGGTPADASADVRKGFEIFVEKVGAMDGKASADEVTKIQKDLTAGDAKAVTTFVTYVAQTCLADQLPDPSQLQSLIPSP